MNDFSLIIDADNAKTLAGWFLSMNPGVQVWTSVNLSNPGAQWLTPLGEGKPTWQAGNEPQVIKDPAQVGVVVMEEVKRFRVGVRMGSQGLSMKVTDGGTRRIRSAVAKAGDGATYTFDYETQEAVILAPAGDPQPLSQFL
jgi:hypothetical protein